MSLPGRARIAGIDYLRAGMSYCVVMLHAYGAGTSGLFSPQGFFSHRFTLSDFINFHIFLLAVPVFILISNYLFVLSGADLHGLTRRVQRLLILMCFWMISFILYRDGFSGIRALMPRSVSDLYAIVFTAGGTHYYFFASLIVTLLVTYLFAEQSTAIVATGLVLSALVLVVLPYLGRTASIFLLSSHWNPLNFIPYSFVAILIPRYARIIATKRPWLIFSTILLAVVFAIYEWRYDVDYTFFYFQEFALPAYTRVSVLCSAAALLLAALHPALRSNSAVTFMSERALALYCLHPFFLAPVANIVARLDGHELVLRNVAIVIIVLCSYAVASLGRYLPRNARKIFVGMP